MRVVRITVFIIFGGLYLVIFLLYILYNCYFIILYIILTDYIRKGILVGLVYYSYVLLILFSVIHDG